MTAIPQKPLAKLIADIRDVQRQRSIVIKSRNMQANRLRAIVAGTLGYHTGLSEKERKALMEKANAIIDGVLDGTVSHSYEEIIKGTYEGINKLEELKQKYDKDLTTMAKRLPVASWVDRPEQRGFGLCFLGIVIGECGNLSDYANPGKLWRRLGCAPWSYDGRTLMGATWRAEGLPAKQWESFGYSPRRRSIAYLIGEGIVKQNGAGPYRSRYDQAKAAAVESHHDWKPLRCHRHAMLLATKLLLKNLWLEWNNHPKEGRHPRDK